MDQQNEEIALIKIFSSTERKGLDVIKCSLYSLYTVFTLQECALKLPEGVFPNYTNIKEYCDVRKELKYENDSSMVKKLQSPVKRLVALLRIQSLSFHERILTITILAIKKLWKPTKEKDPQHPQKKAGWHFKNDKAKKN